MPEKSILPLMDYFKAIQDPRIERKKLYPLIEVIVIALLAIMSGAEGWEDMEDYGNAKAWWLQQFLPLKNGIPKHDVFRRVFIRLIPEQIEQCFRAWVADLHMPIDRQVFAVDGKTIRGSLNKRADVKAAHIVSVWAAENRLVLAQTKVDEKTNEITAIPDVLGMIALKGAIVTIDAMGCQYKIANQIVEAGGDYLFSLKGNQETLCDDVEEYFKDLDFERPEPEVQVYQDFEIDHGRAERRKHGVTGDVQWLIERHPLWSTIQSIGVIEEKRRIGEEESVERRYYVSSLPVDPELVAHAARAHWGIENSLHYILDVMFREDACRIKSGNAPENLNRFRKIALTLVRQDTASKLSIRKRLKKLMWSDEYFADLLFHAHQLQKGRA
jgi:predicted transposase YbfD/YdcC